jgi:hypothetical protein
VEQTFLGLHVSGRFSLKFHTLRTAVRYVPISQSICYLERRQVFLTLKAPCVVKKKAGTMPL